MTTTGAAIEARDLTKTYGKDVRALDGLGFSVEAGTVFGLLGPNGAGKSTTVKILTTLSLPDSGSARVAGVDVLAEPDRVRRSIGLVGQRSGVDLEATGRENLTLQGQVYGLRGAELRDRVGSCWSGSGWPRRPTGSPAATREACSGASTSPWG
jgi:ABC-2 type transport system ATP-binding protein